MMAAILPISVEFQIHQVVQAFQIKCARKLYQKKWDFFKPLSAINSKGTNPKKIKKVKGDTGQAANSSKPENILKLSGMIFFKASF